MNRTLQLLGILALVCISGFPVLSQDRTSRPASKDEHDAMVKEHEQARAEDFKLQQSITRMKAEHCRALAVLARLQAELLDHQAELETASLHIAEHDREMESHVNEIERHEATGDDAGHAEHVKKHKELMDEHGELVAGSDELSGHHVELIREILKLGESHRHGREDAGSER